MLSPEERLTLFDALRPPTGFELDTALATTYSLDLDFLAATLVALSGFGEAPNPDDDESGEPATEPIDVIEAVRRTASRLTVLTQAGQIALRRGRILHAWLEDSVLPVVVPAAHRVFHPKMWFLRYRRNDEVALRLLCASRNLTFDVSWDTMVQLDAALSDDETHPELGAFIQRTLPMTMLKPGTSRASELRSLGNDFVRARFELPEHAQSLQFHPLGVGAGVDPIGTDHRRALVVSPFLAADRLGAIRSSGKRHVLVARESAIRQLGADAVEGFDTYAIDPDADLAASTTVSAVESEVGPPDQHLTGLHAKVYVLEDTDGRRTRLLTGSANATNAAFDGNVEFLTEFVFSRSELSIDAVLGDDADGNVALRQLLMPITAPDQPVELTDGDQLSNELDDLRRAIAERVIRGELRPANDDFEMRLRVDLTGLQAPAGDVIVSCWPTSLTEAASARTLQLGTVNETEHVVSFAGITRFLALAIKAERDGAPAETRFVVPVLLDGIPANRGERLLAALLADPDRFTQYLLMLLADPDSLLTGLDLLRDGQGGSTVQIDDRLPPIFEALMRAVARHPERLGEIGRIADELERAGGGVLPEGWETIWPPIHHAAGAKQ